ncbi:hypothetical protein L593_01645 [Salinarchaeum sp. Harcht-Bsk1]|uniref:DUF6517 family protein n=1 Tax=Salinarchaeum sp. Harcht-Bsk1 TaxID=1333523 RepID=UPI00034244B5|nr:DUF6517 family protein [Salinarchaeum sp. Harcht-Bsk1]AGN00282.1 hypothetical protein L593_01645 [Salinarchaeum sp. Harcht-Bsk1]
MKRQGLLVLAVVGLLVTTGCVGLVLGDGLEMDSEPAAVSDEALAETGFQFSDHRTLWLNETVAVAGQEREINASAHATIYNRTTNLERFERDTGGFVVISTPDVSVAGESANPAARMSNRELVERFQGELESEVGQLGNLTKVSERTEPVLGYAAAVSVFETTTTIEGREVTLYVHVTKVQHEDDLVIGIGVHPEALAQQAPEIHRLLRGIEHPASI